MKEYNICKAMTPFDLIEKVNHDMLRGWVPIGGVAIWETSVLQAMERKIEMRTDSGHTLPDVDF